ncbi:hypothetical protein TIFTF001_010717 [Ficus carica]|uniref:Cytochrome P450 n=1 Tax=Ficus carica TaxID=3494 RepID=A0AA87ZXG1_FICCA|nr:hypothetical protein TIFTF001_010717 [Ficus carica]
MRNKIRKLFKENKRIPPGPPKLPIIGNLHKIGALPHRSLWQLSKQYGPVMRLQLGGVPAVVVSSAEAAKEVLKIHDLDCCSRPPLASLGKLSYNYLDVSFSPYGENWRERRKICVLKLFSLHKVQSFRFVREVEIRSLIDSLRSSSLTETPIDLSKRMFALTASIIFRIAFGKNFKETGLDNDKFEEMIHRAESMLGSFAASDFFPYVGWIVDKLTGLQAKFELSFRELDDIFERVVDEHLNRTPEDQEDIVDLMLSIERDQSKFGEVQFNRDCTKAILMDIFVAGVDTGAITLTWAMAELAKSPRVMRKAQNEVRSYVEKGELVNESDIHQLHYLRMVIKETLRLHPAAPLLLPRETMSQFKLFGYDVYPKTILQVNVWAIGRDPDYWDKPEEFFPERFMNSSIDYRGQHFELLPFGAGRRGCPGIHMAMATVELTLANLLCCFDWKLPDGMKETDLDMDEASGLTTHKKSPLKLVPISYQ